MGLISLNNASETIPFESIESLRVLIIVESTEDSAPEISQFASGVSDKPCWKQGKLRLLVESSRRRNDSLSSTGKYDWKRWIPSLGL